MSTATLAKFQKFAAYQSAHISAQRAQRRLDSARRTRHLPGTDLDRLQSMTDSLWKSTHRAGSELVGAKRAQVMA